MTNFPRNRYNPVELMSLFDSKEIETCDGDFFKSFELDGSELEIYFPEENGVVQEKYLEKARHVIQDIRLLDNLVQDSCENEYLKSKLHVDNFMLYLAFIEIKIDEVTLRYYGEKVNTEWDAVFREKTHDIWEKVNF
ncbi:hypothetical protein [Aliikangiella sp. IMCC44632]|jgi:hypothetical protein